ncbi:MAG: hypothetical protein LBS25_06115 [Candidatus Symbiothrix sp.]|jgi:hypothetical protein|nr:hypothetical protein [Candidatus Symbiothrix sp.]
MKRITKLVLIMGAAVGFCSTAMADRASLRERIDNWPNRSTAGENLRSTTDAEDNTPPGEPDFGSVGGGLLFVTLAGFGYGFTLKKRSCTEK